MGLFSCIKSSEKGKEKIILMLGLDGAGKTKLLYKLQLDQNVVTIPTIGFNVETIEYKKHKLTIWDVGGQDKLRSLWREHYEDKLAIIFIVDSNDHERLKEAGQELMSALASDHLRHCPLLVLANKIDLPQTMYVDQIIEGLGLTNDNIDRPWFIQSCCVVNSQGIDDGLDWLVQRLS